MKFHSDDIKFACFKATVLKIIMLIAMILCRQYHDTDRSLQYRLLGDFNITINDNIVIYIVILILKRIFSVVISAEQYYPQYCTFITHKHLIE